MLFGFALLNGIENPLAESQIVRLVRVFPCSGPEMDVQEGDGIGGLVFPVGCYELSVFFYRELDVGIFPERELLWLRLL